MTRNRNPDQTEHQAQGEAGDKPGQGDLEAREACPTSAHRHSLCEHQRDWCDKEGTGTKSTNIEDPAEQQKPEGVLKPRNRFSLTADKAAKLRQRVIKMDQTPAV